MDTDPISPSIRFDLPCTLEEVFSPACNPEIIAYSPNAPLPVSVAHVGKFLAVQVAAAHMTTGNAGLRTRHLWGGENGVYVNSSSPRHSTVVSEASHPLSGTRPIATLLLCWCIAQDSLLKRPSPTMRLLCSFSLSCPHRKFTVR